MPQVRAFRNGLPWVLAVSALIAASVCTFRGPFPAVWAAVQQPGEVMLEVKSEYSRIKVTRENTTRTLWFIRDNGEEVVESRVDLARLNDLLVEYTRYMFLSYVFRPNPEKVLIVGLGGGSMVHFLQQHDPKVKVDVVEIDPTIVSIADRYFGVRTGRNVNINVTDGLDYLTHADAKYDVIYMDAFLRPSGGTDKVGVPLHLKTLKFYSEVQKRLNPDGVVVFNLNPHLSVQEDIRTIKEAFANTYVFRLTGYDGFVVVASTAENALTPKTISAEAARIDGRFHAPFSFRKMAGRLAR
ncbi:spermidine synthase [Paludisphaera borealis]|uniref:Polyamine aminopropyltransferase n=1 Tax=Paludisphaera borealis TaxID=1387353 RepID=A0A1U7CX59_9BACT|nr:fused MFS/spermidine synthase [Paludisphaera borealis]APW63486.1 Polyamine aminopropyltransferase [Paludisphaera borealis]